MLWLRLSCHECFGVKSCHRVCDVYTPQTVWGAMYNAGVPYDFCDTGVTSMRLVLHGYTSSGTFWHIMRYDDWRIILLMPLTDVIRHVRRCSGELQRLCQDCQDCQRWFFKSSQILCGLQLAKRTTEQPNGSVTYQLNVLLGRERFHTIGDS